MSSPPTSFPDATEPSAPASDPRRDLFVSVATLIVGAAVVAFLTHYNQSGRAVWSTGAFRPGYSWDEYLIVNVTGLLFPALLLILGLFREPAARFGFRSPESGAARIAFFLYLFMLPFLIWASRSPAFRAYYPIQHQAERSWPFLLYFELTYGMYMFAWEWFYRGFLTFGLARRFGYTAAVILQTIGFGIMHYGKPTPEFLGSFVAGLALGALAVRARSFLPCFALHWAVSITFDVLAIHGKPGALF